MFVWESCVRDMGDIHWYLVVNNKLLTIEQTDYLSWMSLCHIPPTGEVTNDGEVLWGTWGWLGNVPKSIKSHITLYVLYNYMIMVNETLVYQTVKAKKAHPIRWSVSMELSVQPIHLKLLKDHMRSAPYSEH